MFIVLFFKKLAKDAESLWNDWLVEREIASTNFVKTESKKNTFTIVPLPIFVIIRS